MPVKSPQKVSSAHKVIPFKLPEILDVGMTARFLTVSADTVYGLFQRGCEGRMKKSAVLRWVEHSATGDTLARALERGDSEALKEALNSGKITLKPRKAS